MAGKIKLTLSIFAMLFAISGTMAAYGGVWVMESGEGGKVSHYEGGDCLSCHRSGEHQLLIGGTVFLTYNSAAPCSGASLQFLNPATNAVVYATKNYYSEDSNGKGNFYIQKNISIASGSYFMRIISADGTTLAQSGAPHAFSGDNSKTDLNNRYSCNLCHAASPSNGAAGPIYAQQNTGKCSDTAAYTPYDGQTLYNTYCAACHNNGSNGAQPVAGVAGRGDDPNITKNAILNNKSRAGVTTNMSVFSFLSNAQLQAIANYTHPISETMPVPDGQYVRSFNPAETPVIKADYASAIPIGIGNPSGGFLNWQVGLPAFPGPMDIFVAVQLNNSLYFLDSNNTLTQTMSAWKTVSGSKVNESITQDLGIGSGNLPVSSLPAGIYKFYVAAFPAGITGRYYLWSTQFTR